MLGFYNYTVVLTYVGMLASFLGVLCAVHGDPMKALLCLMISGLCDMFDGRVASTMKNRTRDQKNFGIQIDSLSDLICFGVLPAVIVCETAQDNRLVCAICGLYLLCALIRLAYFNVDEADRQEKAEAEGNSNSKRKQYQGLPVTSVALILPLIFLLDQKVSGFPIDYAAPIVLFLMAGAFITPFRLKKPALMGMLICSLIGIGELIVIIKEVF